MDSKPVVRLALAGVDGINTVESDELARMWNVFSKCKSSLQEGRRLENLSWRLWHQAAFHTSLPPPFESASSSTQKAHFHDHLSDPEGGCSDSSLSDSGGSPPSSAPRGCCKPPSLHHRTSSDSASSAPSSISRSRDINSNPSPNRMSPGSLKTLIHKVLEPAELSERPRAPRTLLHNLPASLTVPVSPPLLGESETPLATSVPAAELQPPDTTSPTVNNEGKEAVVTTSTHCPGNGVQSVPMAASRSQDESVEVAAASVKSRGSDASATSSRSGHPRRNVVHHVHGHGHGHGLGAHSRARQSTGATASTMRRNLSERALAAKQAEANLFMTTVHSPLSSPSQPARPAMLRRESTSGSVGNADGEKHIKTVRIVEDTPPPLERGSSSSLRDAPTHHRRTSSSLSVRSASKTSQASLTALEPQSIVRGFGPGSVTSFTSMSPNTMGAPPAITSPLKSTSLRNSVTFRPPTPPTRDEPHYKSDSVNRTKDAGHTRNRMFFVGSEQTEEVDGDSSSGWGSDPEDGEESDQLRNSRSQPESLPLPAENLSNLRQEQLDVHPTMFAKRPVKSSADLASAASQAGEISRTASQGLLTALFSSDPHALSRHTRRPADRAAALQSSKSAVTLPARRLGGLPPDVELSDDEEEEPPRPDAIAMPKPYHISNVAARAVVQPPLQLSASQTRRNMLTTELSESLRRNLLWERQSQPGARDRRIVDRRAASSSRPPIGSQQPATAAASVAVDKTNYFANQYHRQGW